MADKGEDTIFKLIVDKKVPATFQHEDDQCIVIKDIHPQAPVHLIVIAKREIRTLDNLVEDDEKLLGHMVYVAAKVAKEQSLSEGYRLVVNNGKEGGQHVYRLHLHILGGRQMNWPPG